MGLITRIADKAGHSAALFPRWAAPRALAIASLGAAIGLGFLQNTKDCSSQLLPLFAVVALLANALGWLSHRQWHRSLLGMIGPAIVVWNCLAA
jgi:mercuric ion transport protein